MNCFTDCIALFIHQKLLEAYHLLKYLDIAYFVCSAIIFLSSSLYPRESNGSCQALRTRVFVSFSTRPICSPLRLIQSRMGLTSTEHDKVIRLSHHSVLTCYHPEPRWSESLLSSNTRNPCQLSPSQGEVGFYIVNFLAVLVFASVTTCQLALLSRLQERLK